MIIPHHDKSRKRKKKNLTKKLSILNAYINFKLSKVSNSRDEPNNEIYCTSVKSKKRYINPLVNMDNKVSRIKDVSILANDDISNFLNMKHHKFIGFNFDFKPYVT